MKNYFWLVVITLLFLLGFFYWVFFYIKKKRKIIVTCQVNVYEDRDCLVYIYYNDKTGSKKVWLYDKEWRQDICVTEKKDFTITASARFLDTDYAKENEFIKETHYPRISGELIYNDKKIKKTDRKSVNLALDEIA